MGCCCADRDNCGDTCERFCPCISMYPNLCTAFLSLIAAAVFITIFAAYSFISLRTSIFNFDWPIIWFILVNASFIALVCVIPLILLALSLWCVCSSYRRAILFKTLFIFMLLITVLALAACMIAAILIIYGSTDKGTFFARELEVVWMSEINQPDSTLACRVQSQLSCRGFEEGDCQKDSKTANFSRCGVRCRPQDMEGKPDFDTFIYPGCREQISSFYIKWNAVLLSGAAIACIFTLIALFVSCSISFELDK